VIGNLPSRLVVIASGCDTYARWHVSIHEKRTPSIAKNILMRNSLAFCTTESKTQLLNSNSFARNYFEKPDIHLFGEIHRYLPWHRYGTTVPKMLFFAILRLRTFATPPPTPIYTKLLSWMRGESG
jgi:hypothetical protein